MTRARSYRKIWHLLSSQWLITKKIVKFKCFLVGLLKWPRLLVSWIWYASFSYPCLKSVKKYWIEQNGKAPFSKEKRWVWMTCWNHLPRQLINLTIWIKFQNSLENPTGHTYMSNSTWHSLLNSKGQLRSFK